MAKSRKKWPNTAILINQIAIHESVGSLTKAKKHLSFPPLRKAMSAHIRGLDDERQAGKVDYSQHDVVMSAFACMYFQDPSLAQFQKRMEEVHHRNNLRTLFGVKNIPGETQLRDILDEIPSRVFAPLFKNYYERLRRHKHLESFEILPNLLLCVFDGTDYHSSKKICCPKCLTKKHRNGETTYRHAVLQGAIMHPDKKQVVPLMPEAIQNGDGKKKQDCESNAAKRFIKNLKATHPRQSFLIGGDGLMSHQPMIEETLAAGQHYLFVAKPGDHRYLVKWLNAFPELPTLVMNDEKGGSHHYRWRNDVPLHGDTDAIRVNFLDYRFVNAAGKTIYRNSWVTDIEINAANVERLVGAGRCRWKIENECFNTMKNQGYYIEHNYGHGKQNLSYNMYLLTLLAFFFHQIFELTDGLYQACRKKCGSKTYLWEVLRGTIRMLVVETWEQLMDMVLNPDDYQVTVTKMS